LKQVMQYVGVSECDMEKGQLRCDANVSVRVKGAKEFGTKAEVKNLNSFRFAKLALDYEIARQVALIESGGKVAQETRLYNVETGETVGMRSKEHAHDYRYFPEPDLLPLRVSDEWMNRIRESLPELPADKRNRFMASYGLGDYDAQVLTADQATSDYFEKAAAVAGDAKMTANWVTTELLGALKSAVLAESPVSAEQLGELVALIVKGEISGKMAKEVFAKMFASGDSARSIVDREGLKQISDEGALGKIVDEVIAANPKQVEQYKSGKTTVLGFLVGQVMKNSKGQANPAVVNTMLKEKLG
jgi:aspartyl-tRNA(Asn)/glutamyl-tRNA(Gln) amidotransferase subunit B